MLVTATTVHALEKRVCAENLALHYQKSLFGVKVIRRGKTGS